MVELGYDVREPYFLATEGQLLFHFFKAGTNPIEFAPDTMYRMERAVDGSWSKVRDLLQSKSLEKFEYKVWRFITSFYTTHISYINNIIN